MDKSIGFIKREHMNMAICHNHKVKYLLVMKWKVLKFGIEYVDVNRLHWGIYTPHHPVLHEESRTIDGMIEAAKNLQSILGWSDEQVAAYSENIKRCSLVEVALSESPSSSLQEAAKECLIKRIMTDHEVSREYVLVTLESNGVIASCYKAMREFAGWNVREAQQTGPILTRELHDMIWEAAQDRLAYDTADGKPFSYAPDKETFAKSLNL